MTKDDMLRYADACGQKLKKLSLIMHDELERMAEGSGLRIEELVLRIRQSFGFADRA